MQSQRFILGMGLIILLVISGTSIGLDTRSRRVSVEADRIVAALRQFADLKVQARAAEAAARGFALTGDAGFADEFRQAREAIAPGFAALLGAIDEPAQRRLLEETSELVQRRLAIGDELIRLRSAGESAAGSAEKTDTEARDMAQTVTANLDKMQAEQRARLARQSADLRLT